MLLNVGNEIYFDDMIDLALELLSKHLDVRDQVRSEVRYVLVDEVQDISMEQAHLIYLLAIKASWSMLVGDEKQSIYGFQGATPECCRKLVNKLDSTVYHLTQTHRLPKQMLGLANGVANDINNDPRLTSDKMGFKPRLLVVDNIDQQADFIASEIQRLIQNGVPLNQIVVIGRTRRSLTLLKDTRVMNDIPCFMGFRSTDSESSKQLLGRLLRLTRWKNSDTNRSRKAFTLPKLLGNHLKQAGLNSAMRRFVVDNVTEQGWSGTHLPQAEGTRIFSDLVRKLRTTVERAALLSPESGTQLLIDYLKPIITRQFKSEKLAILTDLKTVKLSLRDCLSWQDVYVDGFPLSVRRDGVEFVTAHGAKGREWQYVFLINMVEREFPFCFGKYPNNSEEELRLFYVAITRTSKRLVVIQCPLQRNNYVKSGHNKRVLNLNQGSSFIRAYGSKLLPHVINEGGGNE